MKKLIAALVFITIGTMVFALGAREGMTEEEAIAKIEERTAALQLTLEDAEAAEQAFQAIVATGARIRNALGIVTDALEEGLRARDMNELTIRLRARINEKLSAGESEKAARAMVQEQLRLRVRDESGEASGTASQVQTRTGTPAASGTPGKKN
jgi:hypothetical protein